MTTDDTTPRPMLVLRKRFMVVWEQHQPGGCRCMCTMYHRDREPGALPNINRGPACLLAAEPGLLLRVEGSHYGESSDPLPICAACYDALLPFAEVEP